MPSEGDNTQANAIYTPIWEQFVENNHAKFVVIDNSKRGVEAQVEADKLATADILIITGGNTFRLLNHLRLSGLDQAIVKFWQKDNVVLAGFSAGAIVLTPSIETAQTGVTDANDLGITDLTALNIVDFEIWPHYEPQQEQEATEYQKSHSTKVKLIGNDDIVVIDQ